MYWVNTFLCRHLITYDLLSFYLLLHWEKISSKAYYTTLMYFHSSVTKNILFYYQVFEKSLRLIVYWSINSPYFFDNFFSFCTNILTMLSQIIHFCCYIFLLSKWDIDDYLSIQTPTNTFNFVWGLISMCWVSVIRTQYNS